MVRPLAPSLLVFAGLVAAACSSPAPSSTTTTTGTGGTPGTGGSPTGGATSGSSGGVGGTGGTTSATGTGGATSTTSSSATGGADAGTGPCASGATCDGVSGLCAPLPTCSAAAPCAGDPALGQTTFTTPLDLPTCKASAKAIAAGRVAADDGPLRQVWTDPVNGQQRAACVHLPPGASPQSPRPLLLWTHGAGASADLLYNATQLIEKADTAPGFVIIADQGRNLAWPNNPGGPHHDIYYRHFDPGPDQNPDFRALDKLVDDAVATGLVDPKRIYVMGWSNGGFFSQLYGIERHAHPTPGGNRVAAAAVFTAGDPYQGLFAGESPSCASPHPQTTLPIMIVHRACDLVACDAAQAPVMKAFPGAVVEPWIATLPTLGVAAGDVVDRIILADGLKVSACATVPPCTAAAGLLGHSHWPDGLDILYQKNNLDNEPFLLAFLAQRPLP